MYSHDNRIVATLDAGGTNLVFGAMRGCEYIGETVTLPSNSHDLDLCLKTIVDGFTKIISSLEEKPVAISFAFPGPADYPAGIIGGFLPNFPPVDHFSYAESGAEGESHQVRIVFMSPEIGNALVDPRERGRPRCGQKSL